MVLIYLLILIRNTKSNQIRYIDNEAPFEFRNGDIDTDSYVMTGDMPAIHLKRNATMRLLENLQKSIPDLILSDKIHQTVGPKQTYVKVVSQSRSRAWKHDHIDRRYNQNTERQKVREGDTWQRGCYNCGEANHGVKQCRYDQKLRCLKCNHLGHKWKFCRE